jgi:hypothetical protein
MVAGRLCRARGLAPRLVRATRPFLQHHFFELFGRFDRAAHGT